MPSFAKTLCLCSALLLSAAVSADEIYRWVDENGVVNYTQIRPVGVEAEAVSTRGGGRSNRSSAAAPAPQPQPAAAQSQELSPEQQQMLEDLQAAEAAREQEIARIREQNCIKAREVLARLLERPRIRVREAGGSEARLLTEDERQERIDEAQRGVAANCSASDLAAAP